MAREDAQAEWRAANESLRAAAEQLHMARRGVLSGVYNPYELGEALRVYREAKQRACRARDMLASLPDSNLLRLGYFLPVGWYRMAGLVITKMFNKPSLFKLAGVFFNSDQKLQFSF